jgi:hypothetical protein
MKDGRTLVLAVALCVAAGVAVAAQPSGTNSTKQTPQSVTQANAKLTVHHETGTVSSIAANELILNHRWRGKEEKTKFALGSDTKKEGSIEKGDHVMVYYHFEKGHRIATDLKPLGTKPKTETKKS